MVLMLYNQNVFRKTKLRHKLKNLTAPKTIMYQTTSCHTHNRVIKYIHNINSLEQSFFNTTIDF